MAGKKPRRRAPSPITATPAPLVVRDATTGAATVTPAGLELVERLAKRGDELATIAKALSLNPSTFRSVRQRQETAQEAVERGRAAFVDEMKDVLVEAARNGSQVAAMFLLKTRGGWKEGEQTDGGTQRPNINIINLHGALSHDAYAKLIEANPGALPALPAPKDDKS
jgi:hypothetical protein